MMLLDDEMTDAKAQDIKLCNNCNCQNTVTCHCLIILEWHCTLDETHSHGHTVTVSNAMEVNEG